MTMGETIRLICNELVGRWTQRMPCFFKRLVIICVCVIVTSYGVNTMLQMTGAIPHQWWTDIYPLLIGVPSGMVIACKFTVAGGFKDIDHDRRTNDDDIPGNPRRYAAEPRHHDTESCQAES